MGKIKILACLLVASVLSSCAEKLQMDMPVPEKAVSSKLIFTSENAVAGKLLVYFDAEAAGTVESSSSAATDMVLRLTEKFSSPLE